MACGILVPQPEIKPSPPAVGAQRSNHWSTREFPSTCFYLFFKNNFIHYFFLAVLGLRCCTGFSLVAALGLLTVAASLWGTRSRRAAVAVVSRGLCCSAACGLFPDQGSNLCGRQILYHWATKEAPQLPAFIQLFPCMSLNRAASRAESVPTPAEGLISGDLGGGKESCIIRYI